MTHIHAADDRDILLRYILGRIVRYRMIARGTMSYSCTTVHGAMVGTRLVVAPFHILFLTKKVQVIYTSDDTA